MDQKILDQYEEKGLSCPFSLLRSGDVFISQKGEPLKKELSQIATVIFETIGTIGNVKIDTIEIMGDKKGVIMEVEAERLVGSLFYRTPTLDFGAMWSLIKELRGHPSAAVVPEVKPKVKLEASILDKMKAISKDYLGDFTERIYQNQLKTQRIKPDEFYDEDARRLIFALGKAAGMIIGPSKGTELTNKLLKILK
jgi:hypothetical protein